MRVSDKVRSGPVGSGRARVVEFSLYIRPTQVRARLRSPVVVNMNDDNCSVLANAVAMRHAKKCRRSIHIHPLVHALVYLRKSWRRWRFVQFTGNSVNVARVTLLYVKGGWAAEWLACWTQAQKARVQIAAAALSGNSLRQTVHTHRASVHQSAKLVAALLRVARVTAGLAEGNGSLPQGL